MKVLVYYNPGVKNDVFEGTRLRKNIKGALELNDVEWVENIFALPDIVHFLSPLDEAKANDAKTDGLKVVVSALYCESDPYARFLIRNSDGKFSLPARSLRILETADLILVPSSRAKAALEEWHLPHQKIKIVTPGVNSDRFEESDPVETTVFNRYFRFASDKKYVLTVGDYDDEKTLKSLKIIAKADPDIRFFFLGPAKGHEGLVKRLRHEASPNLFFSGLIEDDVFRSGMMRASVFLAFATQINSPLIYLEAMASKSQIVYVGSLPKDDLLIDKKNCLMALTPEKAAKIIESYCLDGKSSTIIEGHRTAKAGSLLRLGKNLKRYYESLLQNSEEEK